MTASSHSGSEPMWVPELLLVEAAAVVAVEAAVAAAFECLAAAGPCHAAAFECLAAAGPCRVAAFARFAAADHPAAVVAAAPEPFAAGDHLPTEAYSSNCLAQHSIPAAVVVDDAAFGQSFAVVAPVVVANDAC